MKILRYNIVLQPEPEGGFTVTVPSLPGCISYGKTLDQAKKMITDAIQLYIYSLKKHNEPVPSSDESYISFVELKTEVKPYV